MACWFRGQITSQRSEIEDENLDGCEAETNCEDIIARKKRSSLVMEDEKHFRLQRGKKYHCDDCSWGSYQENCSKNYHLCSKDMISGKNILAFTFLR